MPNGPGAVFYIKSNAENVKIIGKGTNDSRPVLRMNIIDEYGKPRGNAIFLTSCKKAVIKNIIIKDSSSEGIHVGFARGVIKKLLVENCLIDHSFQNNMAISSLVVGVICNCVF